MSYNSQQCLDKATECDQMAFEAKERDAKAAFAECARQWLQLARQKKEMER